VTLAAPDEVTAGPPTYEQSGPLSVDFTLDASACADEETVDRASLTAASLETLCTDELNVSRELSSSLILTLATSEASDFTLPGNHPITDALNTKPKYLASTTLTEPRWANTTVLSGDLAAAIGELKAKPGGELQVHGSGALIRWLLENDLVDEINLLIVPVVLGQGTRLFPDAGPDIALDLVESRADSKGVRSRSTGPPGARSMQPPPPNTTTTDPHGGVG